MKKFAGWLLFITMGFMSCTGPMGPEGPPGYSTEWFVNDYDVLSEKWIPREDVNVGPFFEYTVNIPELDDFVFNEGAVVCYLVHNVSYAGRTTLVQSPLPYTVYGLYDDGFTQYSENYSYEVGPGFIRFITKYSDFDTGIFPLNCTFHVVLMW